MADIERILIVGGGIAGLSAAAALHRQELTAELIERSPTWPVIGAGINLPANGVRALRALGATTAAEQFGAPIQHWGFFDQQGELLCQTDLEDLWRDVGVWGLPAFGCTTYYSKRLSRCRTDWVSPSPN